MNRLRVFQAGLMVGTQEYLQFWNPVSWFYAWLPRILFQATFFALLGVLLGTQEQEQLFLIGGIVAVAAHSETLTITATTWDRTDGTYPLIVISPSSLVPVTLGRTSVWLVDGLLSALTTLVLLNFVFNADFSLAELSLLLPLLALICVSIFCLAICVGGLISRYPRARNIVGRIAWSGLLVFSGALVPTGFWPQPIEALTNILPVTHGLKAMRLILSDGESSRVLIEAGLEVAVLLAWMLIAAFTLDRLADGGRRDGSIEFV